MSDLVGERKCIRCDNPIHPTAKATHGLMNEPLEVIAVVAHVHGYCSYDCIRLYSLHKAFIGEAWWQK